MRGDITHGTCHAYNFHECRCTLCRAAAAAYQRLLCRRIRERIAAGETIPPTIKHGTDNAYCRWRCRCKKCRKHWADKQHNMRLRLKGTEPKTHGTWAGYKTYGCRCALCTEANTAAFRRYRQRRKAKEALAAIGLKLTPLPPLSGKK